MAIFNDSAQDLFQIENSVLHLRGFSIGTIRTVLRLGPVGETSMFANIHEQEVQRSWKCIRSAVNLPQNLYDITGEPMDAVLWRTAQADVKLHEGRALRRLNGDEAALPHAGNEPLENAAYYGRHFALTDKALLGLVPLLTMEGDLVFVLAGGSVLYVLRPMPEAPGKHQFIGQCYFHGMMDGEALAMLVEGTAVVTTVKIA